MNKKPAAKKTTAAATKATKPRKPPTKPSATRTRKKPPPTDPLRERVEKVRGMLDGKKGVEIVVLNVAKVSSVTDYMILCTGLNTPHLRALADEVARQLRQETPPVGCHKRAGSAESEWLVLDYLDFVVHLFTLNTRAYYAIEQLWKDAPVV